ncbi:unnamed protein product [Didymodactylos carnosus]|uniref:Uncharacterized protein n=1 Tax=Didymodactylos carnosus TaxID=1234261 RepID=A0A815S8N4_9BILA|nr:unnamed protein product [Didymodactylos carnosus]CAF4349145.1 unnamed protein product [Didymodactylos carnosus]
MANKRCNYEKEDLEKAIKAYKNDEMPSVAAAKAFNIPESTIRKHKSNPVLNIGGGRPRFLTDDQEEYLVVLFQQLETIGVRLTKDVVLKIAGEYMSLIRQGRFDEKGELVVVSIETQYAFEQFGGTGRQFTTALICCNAAGEVMPPFIIYSAKNLSPTWCNGGPVGTTYNVSESGWINETLFTTWFETSFIPYTAAVERPILLIMDDHAAHINIKTIELAKQHHIILLLLPPHTTHALQPLDVATFNLSTDPITTTTNFSSLNSNYPLNDDLSSNQSNSEIPIPASKFNRLRPLWDDDSDTDKNIDTGKVTPNVHGNFTKKYKKYSILDLDSSDEEEKTYTSLNSVPLSPTSAVRSIVTNVIHQLPPPSPLTITRNTRIRAERRYGEEITTGNLLDELKQKAVTKPPTRRGRKPKNSVVNPPSGGTHSTINIIRSSPTSSTTSLAIHPATAASASTMFTVQPIQYNLLSFD